MAKLSKDTVHQLLYLFRNSPWLNSFDNEVVELLEISSSLEQQTLLIKLLKLIHFLKHENYQEALTNISQKVHQDYGLRESSTMLVSFAADDQADSSQVVLYDLRSELTRYGWRNTRTVNRFGKAQKYLRDYKNVVLLDEFIGTGRTLCGRIAELKKHFAQINITDYKIYPCVIAGMSIGLDRVYQETGYEVYAVKRLQKGISELLPEDERYDAVALMKELEANLLPNIDNEMLPSFGDGASEALYGRDGGNCPNSVFPIFWWPYDLNSNQRKTLFIRNFGIN